jgi:hypothetical protein
VRKVDAPPAGWYPDPESRTNLRWWDGLDWTDVRRAPPSSAETLAAYENAQFRAAPPDFAAGASRAAAAARQLDSDQVVNDVRNASRAEMQRATEAFQRKALEARLDWTPLISEYTSKAKRWVRMLIRLAIVAFLIWLAFQIVQQVSIWNWITDRIDNITDDESGMASSILVPFGPHRPGRWL